MATLDGYRRSRPAALTGVAALALTGCGWQWSASKNESLNSVVALDPNSSDERNPSARLGDENFLIVGIDSRAGANGEMGAGGVHRNQVELRLCVRWTEVSGQGHSETVGTVDQPVHRTGLRRFRHELGTVLDHARRQILDGRAALNHVRARQVATEVNGDYGWIKRQQLFLFLSSPLRTDDTRAIFDAIINDDPLPEENNENATTTPPPRPT